jgi:hypothetical protein
MEIKLYSNTPNKDQVRKMSINKQRNINISSVTFDAEPQIIRIPLKKVGEFIRPEIMDMYTRRKTFPNYATRQITG